MNEERQQQKNILPPLQGEDWVCTHDAEGHCMTCSDQAVLVTVLEVDARSGTALVQTPEVMEPEEVDITLIEQVTPGDELLVHGGVAISRQAGGG
jgi:hydrogenase maturation factor